MDLWESSISYERLVLIELFLQMNIYETHLPGIPSLIFVGVLKR